MDSLQCYCLRLRRHKFILVSEFVWDRRRPCAKLLLRAHSAMRCGFAVSIVGIRRGMNIPGCPDTGRAPRDTEQYGCRNDGNGEMGSMYSMKDAGGTTSLQLTSGDAIIKEKDSSKRSGALAMYAGIVRLSSLKRKRPGHFYGGINGYWLH